jgi:hypothetical protein
VGKVAQGSRVTATLENEGSLVGSPKGNRQTPFSFACYLASNKATVKKRLRERSLHPDYHRRLAPELLQAVVLSQAGSENVDDHTAIVNQHPPRRGNPLNVQRNNPFLRFHLFQDFIYDSSKLTFAGSAADDEVVGQQGNLADVQQDDVGALLVGDEFNYFPGQLRRIWLLRSYAQKSPPFQSPRYVCPRYLSSSKARAQIYSFDFHLCALRHRALDQQHLLEL